MNDGQKYDGKENSTPSNQLNGSNPEQTVNSSPSAAQADHKTVDTTDQTESGNTSAASEQESDEGLDRVDLDELRQEYNLDDVDIQMLTDLYRDGCSSEVIISKAKRLANLVVDEQSPFAMHYRQMDNAEFIKSLTLGYDLTPDDVLTVAGMVQKGCPRDLIERTAKRFVQYPAVGNIINHLLDLKSDETAESTPKPEGDLGAQMEILVNARFGRSHADVLIFALTEYQDSRLKLATQALVNEEYDDAANELSDFDSASTMLTELALSLSKLADQNYWATRGETPMGKSKDSNVFESNAKHYFGFSDERIQRHVNQNY